MENHNNNENLCKMTNGWNGTNNSKSSSDRNGTTSTTSSSSNSVTHNNHHDPHGTAASLTVNNLTTSQHSTEEESDDDYYVYTYKGDSRENQMADLPSSFFKFDLKPTKCRNAVNGSTMIGGASASVNGTSYSNGNNGMAHDMFSPDMDFLEMDFDPDVNTEVDDYDPVDSSGEANDEDQLPSLAQNCSLYPEENESEKRRKQSPMMHSGVCSSIPSTSSSSSSTIPPASSRLVSDNNLYDTVSSSKAGTSKDCKIWDTVEVFPAGCSNTPQDNYQNNKGANTVGVMPHVQADSRVPPLQRENHQLTLRLVKSNTLPELGSQPCEISSFTNNLLPVARGSSLFSSEPVFGDSSSDRSYRAVINTSSQSSKVADELVELEVGRIMIWDVEEAKRLSISQIGTSACGATAILNVMRALKIEKSPEFVNQCVGTRLRAENADLPQYLFSRSSAGATHEDLIAGVQRASNDLIYARLFPVKREITSPAFSKWLLYWICKGGIPIATRNLQIGNYRPHEIPDAWHHQMIFGVSPQGIYMESDSLGESVPVAELLPQLSSDSVLLVRRQDIISRKGPMTDLRQLTRHPDPRWNEMNVLGQVANILLEEIPIFNENNAARRVRSSHITIPADYRGGIIFCMHRESPNCQLLMTAPELCT